MQLSIRLAAVSELAKNANRLADIGTDHGYVPIFLMLQGRLQHAIAMDINRGPLLRAQEHIRQYHLEDRIETRLSDGAKELRPNEVDTVVIAGMGGPLMIKILTEGAANLSGVKTFVLQPQSELELFRRFLHQQEYSIVEEAMVKDEGKYYPMMKVVRGRQEAWEDFEYCYGKFLIEQQNPCLLEFLDKEEKMYSRILASLALKTGENIRAREIQIQNSIAMIRRAKGV